MMANGMTCHASRIRLQCFHRIRPLFWRPLAVFFFAATPAFEEQLPNVDDETHHAAVILSLRACTDLGSTFIGVIECYAGQLIALKTLNEPYKERFIPRLVSNGANADDVVLPWVEAVA